MRAIPQMAKAAFLPELRTAFETIWSRRADTCAVWTRFPSWVIPPRESRAKSWSALIEECDEIVRAIRAGVRDAGLIAAERKAEPTRYRGLRDTAHVRRISRDRSAAQALQATWTRNTRRGQNPDAVAESSINVQAAGRGAGSD